MNTHRSGSVIASGKAFFPRPVRTLNSMPSPNVTSSKSEAKVRMEGSEDGHSTTTTTADTATTFATAIATASASTPHNTRNTHVAITTIATNQPTDDSHGDTKNAFLSTHHNTTTTNNGIIPHQGH